MFEFSLQGLLSTQEGGCREARDTTTFVSEKLPRIP